MRALAAFSVVATLFLSACTSEDSAVGSGDTALIKLQVEGMACGVMCPPKIKEDLMAVKGVEEVKVDFETKTATVRISGDVDSGALVKSLREQFTATVKN